MSRIAAAYNALHEHLEPNEAADTVDYCCADLALAAADAVMFSDEAIEVAEELLREKFCVDENMGEFDATAVWGTPSDIVAAVVSALKGDA